MTQTEQNFAQIEKELLEIVLACEKLIDQYIFGRSDVAVESGHKSLETIFDNGPPFNSEDSKSSSKEWDFHYLKSFPCTE